MATASVQLTFRDLDLFSAIERCPLTVRQLRALSVTFKSSFGSDRRLQDRLAILRRADLLRHYRYAATEGSGQYYYTLSPESYRLLHGSDAAVPSPGLFREVGIGRQHHTRCLADFVVKTVIAAHAAGVNLGDFARENTLRLSTGEEHLYPDCAFALSTLERPPFTFYVELDNSTEPLASPRACDSWQRKLQFYDRLQDHSPFRFRVLAVVTKSFHRIDHLLTLAGSLARNPQRSLLYAVYLPDYLEHTAPLTTPLFTDHRGLRVSLLPHLHLPAEPAQRAVSVSLAEPVAV